MKNKQSASTNLRRLYLLLSFVWAILWVTGVVVFASMAIELGRGALENDLDAELKITATGTYGLVYFDEEGFFHQEYFLQEPNLANSPFDIWIVEPGDPGRYHMAPNESHFQIKSLVQLAEEIVSTQENIFIDGIDDNQRPYRLHARPTYEGSEIEIARAAIFILADPAPIMAAQREFTRQLILLALAIGAIGIAVGIGLARWALRPLAASFRERERFLALTAHELRGPVAALKGVSDSAKAGDESQTAAFNRMIPLVDRTVRVVDELLLFARLDVSDARIEPEKFRLDLLAETCLPEKSAILFEAQETVVNGDPRLIKVVIRNLIENAMRHSGCPPESIRVSVSNGAVQVDDDGPGFPEYILALDQEFSPAPSRKGSGLGLAIVRLIAQLHGGRLQIENLPGGGGRAVFYISSARVS